MAFTDTDEPLTFVAHGNSEVLRVSKVDRDQSPERRSGTWLVELFTPAGRSAIIIGDEAAKDLAAMMAGSWEPKT
jgi:hypothetical protein